jgi:hypothetical protein
MLRAAGAARLAGLMGIHVTCAGCMMLAHFFSFRYEA